MEDPDRRQFVIGACLGRGGFGEVYRATMRSPGGLQTEVALKVLRSDLRLEADAVPRLRDEGRLLARIQHPVAVRAYDLTRLDGRLGLVTELVEGADLASAVTWPDRPGPRALLQVIGPVASALASAWEALDGERPLRIVHRDIKPTNIRIGRHGEVKLLDFGIASFTAGDRHAKTASDVVVGSLPYMAPERFLEGGRADAPADVFGLGCCLFEGLLAGERFHPDGKLRTLSSLALDELSWDVHAHDRIARLAGQPPPVVELVEQCLAWDPAGRPTAAMLATACEALADQLPGPSLRRWCREREWSDAPPVQGSLEGRTLVEDPLGGPQGAPGRSNVTLDLAMFDDGGPLPKKPPAPTPRAPPAFPSIPLGMAIEQLQISEAEVSEALGSPPPAAEKRRAPEPAAPPALPAPVAPPAEPERSGVLQWALLTMGCFLLGTVAAGLVVVAAGVIAYVVVS